jgi:hypothetical protein
MHQMATKLVEFYVVCLLILLFLKVKLTSLNVIKMLLVASEKQQLKISLNALIQHQEYLITLMNALYQLNLHILKNLNEIMKKVVLSLVNLEQVKYTCAKDYNKKY